MYENTDARTHRVAAELIEAGVDVNEIFRRLYERVPEEKLRLIARALGKIDRRLDGAPLDHLHLRRGLRGDRRRRDADRGHHRLRPRDRGHRGRRRRPRQARRASARPARSACARPTAPSTSRAIARKMGGGGHQRAAGFSTDRSYDELVEFLIERDPRRSSPEPRVRPAGFLLVDKPAGVTSHDVVARVAPRARRPGRARRDARPVRHRPADRPARPRRRGCSATCSACRRPTWRPRGSAGARARATPTAS